MLPCDTHAYAFFTRLDDVTSGIPTRTRSEVNNSKILRTYFLQYISGTNERETKQIQAELVKAFQEFSLLA